MFVFTMFIVSTYCISGCQHGILLVVRPCTHEHVKQCLAFFCTKVRNSQLYFQGKFTIAAKHHITIAEVYETELVDLEKVRKRKLRMKPNF